MLACSCDRDPLRATSPTTTTTNTTTTDANNNNLVSRTQKASSLNRPTTSATATRSSSRCARQTSLMIACFLFVALMQCASAADHIGAATNTTSSPSSSSASQTLDLSVMPLSSPMTSVTVHPSIVEAADAVPPHLKYTNRSVDFLATGNELWDGLVNECLRRPTMSCFQKNVYTYLDDTLQAGDVHVAGGLRFLKNKVDTLEALEAEDGGVAAEDEERSGE